MLDIDDQESHVGRLLRDRELPSARWAKMNLHNLKAIEEVALAEAALVEALKLKELKNSRNNSALTALGKRKVAAKTRDLDAVYEKHGVTDEYGLPANAKAASTLFTDRLHAASLVKSRS